MQPCTFQLKLKKLKRTRLRKFLMLQKWRPRTKLPTFSQEKTVLIFQETKITKFGFIYQEMEFSSSKLRKKCYIFLLFFKKINLSYHSYFF